MSQKPKGCKCHSPPEALLAHGAQMIISTCSVHGEIARPDLWAKIPAPKYERKH